MPALQQRHSLLAVLQEWSLAFGRDSSVSSAFAVLIQMLSDLDLSIRSRSLRNAYALSEPSAAGMSRFFDDPGILTARRRRLADGVGLHPDTIENYENEKIAEIALTLLEGPPPTPGVRAAAPDHANSPMRVFVGGTVADLDEYWHPAQERVVAQTGEGTAIEILKNRDQRNRQPLLDEVSACDVYVGIIGHHFGDPSADPLRSATMAEHDRARALGKQLLIYLVESDGAGPEGPEPPGRQQLQAEFRRELMLRFSPWSFDSAADLEMRVRHDLARLMQEFSQPNSPYRVFHSDLQSVRDVLDTRNQSTRAQVVDFIEFLAEQFRPLFAIAPDSYNDHPILREAKRRLSDLIPEVGLSVADGVVRRAGVRHVIMRTETVVRMLQTPHRLDAKELEEIDEGFLATSRLMILYSGGLDGTYLLHHIHRVRPSAEVIVLSCDLGGGADINRARMICERLPFEHIVLDQTATFVRDYVFPSIAAQACYGGTHPISASLSRPLLARTAFDEATRRGCSVILHTADATQNSLRRFNRTLADLGFNGRYGSPFSARPPHRKEKRWTLAEVGIIDDGASIFSTDVNIWCREFEAAGLDDPENIEIPESLFHWTRYRSADPVEVEVTFEAGIPVALDGVERDGISLISRLNDVVGQFGLGRFIGLEEIANGQKVQEVREMPAAMLLMDAYRRLEQAIHPASCIREKMHVEQLWVQEAVEGRWLSPLREASQSFISTLASSVSGRVRYLLSENRILLRGLTADSPLYVRDRSQIRL